MPISLKTGSGGLPISAILPLNSTQTIYTPEGGGVWLRSGTITDDLTTYPKATTTLAGYFDNFFSHGSELTNAVLVVTNGTDFWVIKDNAYSYKYDSSGSYASTPQILSGVAGPVSGVWDGANYHFLSGPDRDITEFDSNLSATGSSFSAAGQIFGGSSIDDAIGLTWDGTYFYAANRSNVYQYSAGGSYTGFSFSHANSTLQDIEYFDGFLWLMEASGKTLKYGLDGIYTGDFFEVVATSDTTNPYGITSDSESFWIGGSNNNIVSQFTPYVGIAFIAFDTDSEKPLYVKVA